MMQVPQNAPTLTSNNNPFPSSRTYPFSPDATSNPNVSKLPGYYIESENDIVPKYIPMDGSISYFPFKDLSKIIIKQWDANGLNTLVYTLSQPASPAQTTQGQPQAQPDVDPVARTMMETLQGINSGLASTFGQISQNMGKMQDQLDQMSKVMMNEFGGRG